jgi:hypothetical protein
VEAARRFVTEAKIVLTRGQWLGASP